MKKKTQETINPKDIIGRTKLPVHKWPNTATAMGVIALLEGDLKYGRANFRAVGISASIYYDAARRHLDAWFEGEECDKKTGVPHIASALACIAIIIDAKANGVLTDDRNFSRNEAYRKMVDEMVQHIPRLKEQFKDKKPRHYTIQDNGKV